MRYTHLLLDADGTLLDFDSAEREALQNTLDEFRIPFKNEYIRLYHDINDSWWKRYERGETDKAALSIGRFRDFLAAVDAEDTDVQALAAAYMNYLSLGSQLIDGAAEVCTRLSLRCRLYIITNGTAFIQRRRWSNVPQSALFSDVFISDEIGASKPSKEYFDYVLGAIGEVDKERILVIGDSLTSDILGGVNAGLDTCWFNPAHKPLPENAARPTYIIDDLFDLLPLIAGEGEDEAFNSAFATLYTHDLERERNFYTTYLGGVSGEINRNLRSGFSSCYISFEGGTALELVSLPVVGAELEDERTAGWSHMTVCVGSEEEVVRITDRIRRHGYAVIAPPAGTPLSARVLDPDGNIVSIRA